MFTQQLMAVVSTLSAKVDNLSTKVPAFTNEFAAFKNQQYTVCSGTSPSGPNFIFSERCSAGPRRE
ncbi:hypothetical protein E2C01_056440 [Portunus trituberculatus]|uniref:Uncharacterized protein n=1 Tax=Portunus trituberculatus TaxID=210409 RepID=A0A5B7GXP9_PORTR|nr:hypothetical protein [Portunus trituberculatus]